MGLVLNRSHGGGVGGSGISSAKPEEQGQQLIKLRYSLPNN
jgi:hypothetical protein